jgi:hypothetical protein
MARRFPAVGALLMECVHPVDAERPCSEEVLDRLCAALFELELRTSCCRLVFALRGFGTVPRHPPPLHAHTHGCFCSVVSSRFPRISSHVFVLLVRPSLSAAPTAVGPFPTAWFAQASASALRLSEVSAQRLVDRLGPARAVSRADGEAALAGVAGDEEAEAGPAGGRRAPFRSRCTLNRCRRYHLGKALSVPPPAAPLVVARTMGSVTLQVHGYVTESRGVFSYVWALRVLDAGWLLAAGCWLAGPAVVAGARRYGSSRMCVLYRFANTKQTHLG